MPPPEGLKQQERTYAADEPNETTELKPVWF